VQLDCRRLGPRGGALGRVDRQARSVELRDGDGQRSRRQGLRQAVGNVGRRSRGDRGHEASEQASVDQALLELDGTPNKSALGANAILAVSLAVAARAATAGPAALRYLGGVGARLMPVPMLNVLTAAPTPDNRDRLSGVHAGARPAPRLLQRDPLGAEVFPR